MLKPFEQSAEHLSPLAGRPHRSHLGHLGEVQRGPLLLDLLRPPPLDADLFVVEDAGLGAAAGQAGGAAAQLGRAGRAVLGAREALVRAGQGPLNVHPVPAVPSSSRFPGLPAAERVGAGGQAEAGAPLHGGHAVGVALDAAAAVAAPLLHRRPHLGAQRSPGGATARHLIREGQRAALALAGRGGGVAVGVAEAQVLDQVGDGAGGGRVPRPPRALLALVRQAVPDAGARLLELEWTFPAEISPSVIFWFRREKERKGGKKKKNNTHAQALALINSATRFRRP